MTRALYVKRSAPGITVQDLGRTGYLSYGVSRGGAADPLALAEGAALLGQDPKHAGIEMAAVGGVFEANEDMRIALTGATMHAKIDGKPLRWNASHVLPAGARLAIEAATNGNYGYLSVGGGLALPKIMGAQSAHLAAGIGGIVETGTALSVGPDSGKDVGWTLTPELRLEGGPVRVVPSLQTELFDSAEISRFEETVFKRDVRSNRMGARLAFDGPGFSSDSGLSILSEVIVPGDIQITGDGTPFVLLNECQTVGGYPRIGCVLPSDLPKVAQAPTAAPLRFKFVPLEQAVEIEARAGAARRALPDALAPLVRDPRKMSDLLAYQLISGVVSGV
ncbi:MAG: biotin-dependent carboxyltransferase family protein [Pseudomonadota bacterium]